MNKKILLLIVFLLIPLVLFLIGKISKGGDFGKADSADMELLFGSKRNVMGDQAGTVKIVAFLDLSKKESFEVYNLAKVLVGENPDKVYFVMRYFPNPSVKNSLDAVQAAEGARAQQKLWEMVEILAARAPEWQNTASPRELFGRYAKELGLEIERFYSAYDALRDVGTYDLSVAKGLSITSAPVLYINGELYKGKIDLESLSKVVKSAPAPVLPTEAPSGSPADFAPESTESASQPGNSAE